MGRFDSSKLTLDGHPRQYFGRSRVSPRDQIDSQSVIRGGGSGTTLPDPTPINVAWCVMPSPHAAAAARSPYVSATSRGTTKDCHPRDDPRDKPIDASDVDHRGRANSRRRSRSPPTLADLHTRTRTSRADTSARLLKVL
ncbi:hypothetical protein B296_00028177 [Ensete ventricosum]|uniref:Uncharacterized protein n=1 Tax=Ensete ventricosum TaxID=4639 RepID=A0A426YP20_ENSVE|nr:hypothetical protein B296_00028177 [Ensete ventricosum]